MKFAYANENELKKLLAILDGHGAEYEIHAENGLVELKRAELELFADLDKNHIVCVD